MLLLQIAKPEFVDNWQTLSANTLGSAWDKYEKQIWR